MKTIYPSYYKKFRCIADKCRHSCCIGWEIDVDQDTLSYYDTVSGALGERFKTCISRDGQPHFILGKGERCPFLAENGLCDIISKLGEDALCEICSEHPRFRNYYKGCVELGLGLCCEAAAELILSGDEAFELIGLDIDKDDYSETERELLRIRSELIDIMQDRSLAPSERHLRIAERIGYTLPDRTPAEWCRIYLSLERLDERWTSLLEALAETDELMICTEQSLAAEQLTIYFLYRYLCSATTQKELSALIGFALLSTKIILSVSDRTGESICEVARIYSSEIEYSDENLSLLCESL